MLHCCLYLRQWNLLCLQSPILWLRDACSRLRQRGSRGLCDGLHGSQPSWQPYRESYRHHNSSKPCKMACGSCVSATKHADLQAVPAVPLPAAQQPNKTTALRSCETADADGMQQPRPHNPPPLCHCLPMCLTWLTWLQNPQQVEQCVVLAHAGEVDPESCSHALLALCACPGSQGSSRQKSAAAMRMGKPPAPEKGLLLEVGSHTIALTLLITPLQGLEQHRSLADT